MKNRLKQIRDNLGKTQKEMSTLLGLGEITWQNYERGVTSPKADILKKLDDMGYSMSWIMLGVGSMLKDSVAEDTEYADFSGGMSGVSGVNSEKVFRALLEEFNSIYAKQLSKLPKNFVEITAFRKTMEVIKMANNPVSAFDIMQKIVKHEMEMSKVIPANERFKEIID